jgi:hypothetical protein
VGACWSALRRVGFRRSAGIRTRPSNLLQREVHLPCCVEPTNGALARSNHEFTAALSQPDRQSRCQRTSAASEHVR